MWNHKSGVPGLNCRGNCLALTPKLGNKPIDLCVSGFSLNFRSDFCVSKFISVYIALTIQFSLGQVSVPVHLSLRQSYRQLRTLTAISAISMISAPTFCDALGDALLGSPRT